VAQGTWGYPQGKGSREKVGKRGVRGRRQIKLKLALLRHLRSTDDEKTRCCSAGKKGVAVRGRTADSEKGLEKKNRQWGVTDDDGTLRLSKSRIGQLQGRSQQGLTSSWRRGKGAREESKRSGKTI